MRLFRRGESASTLELLVAGLGNPGARHQLDRHNVGWMVIDELARRHDASFKSKFNGRIADVRIERRRFALLKPETFVNESGRSIGAAMRYYKVDAGHVVVAHDEVDLPLGRLQVRVGGGLAGHNGLRSIAQQLGTSEFLRLRIGVGRPERGDPRDIAGFVLSPFEAHEDSDLVVARAADAVEVVIAQGLEEAQRRFNERA
jgi:peptidyl-tRNA hydrolase, PTH1 family